MTKNWKFRSIWFLLALAIVTASAAGLAAAAEEEAIPAEHSGEAYIVRLDGRNLGAYSVGEGEMLFSVRTDPESMPAADRKMLEEGVYASTLEEVLFLFEDFCS